MDGTNDHLKEVVAGSIAGVMQTLVGYPFDTVKVRYIESKSTKISSCIRMMIKDNGIKSFYQGIRSPLYGGVFYNTNMFYSYSLFDKYISRDTNSIFYNSFICGALVGVTTTVIECPIDLIKTQMQLNKNITFKELLFNTNIRTLYRGVYPTIIRNIPASGLYFGVYNHFYNYYSKQNRPLFGSLIAGGLAGLVCWSTTYPLDNIKTRIQGDNLSNNKRKYKSMMDCIKKTSFRQMWSGFIPCVIRAVPVNSAIFFGYEYAKQTMD